MKKDKNTSAEKMEQIQVAAILTAGPNRQIVAKARDKEIIMDIRKEWGGDDAGPTPGEFLVIALGGCIFNICRILATQKQIILEHLQLSVSGDIDPSRAFGMETDARAGFSHLSVQVKFSSELTDSEKAEFHQELLLRCPLCDTIINPTPLQIVFY
jgi:putative redox protein